MPGHVRKRGKRADGTTKWQARYIDPSDTLGLRRIEKTFRSRNAADEWLTQQQASVLRGEHQDPRRADRPFKDAVAAWRETRLPVLAPKTKDRYDEVLRLYLEPAFGNTPLVAVTREVVKRYFARLQREGKTGGRERPGQPLSAGTVRKVQTVLSSVLSEAVELEMIRVNPAMRLHLPAAAERDMTILTAQEVRNLANAIDHEYRVALLLTTNTGMRAGEVWALRRKDVDLLHGKIHVRQAVKRDTASADAPSKTVDMYGREVGPPKNGKPRTITIGKQTREMLSEHLLSPTKGHTGPDGAVFHTKEGRAVRHGLFMREFYRPAIVGDPDNEDKSKRRPAALPAEKANLTFHDLRHTCASLLIAKGSPLLYVSKRLGHASITTTNDQYGHMFPSVEASLADALDEMYDDQEATLGG